MTIKRRKCKGNNMSTKYSKEDFKTTSMLIICLFTIMVCTFSIISVYEEKSLLDIIQEVATEAESIMMDGKSGLVKLSDEVIPANNQPELNAKRNNYNMTNLYADGDLRYYYKGNNCISETGIDVSYYQGKIDWKKVKKAGIDFAIIRLGYRGYLNGTLKLDSRFKYNIKEAQKAGVKVGVYFFTQALTEQEAVEEAKFCIKNVKKYDLEYPIVIDTEAINNEKARSHVTELDADELTKVCNAFCKTVDKAGYESSIYASKSWFLGKLNIEKLDNCNKWLAHYTKVTDYIYDYNMWQYTSNGRVDGIKGRVDMNICIDN